MNKKKQKKSPILGLITIRPFTVEPWLAGSPKWRKPKERWTWEGFTWVCNGLYSMQPMLRCLCLIEWSRTCVHLRDEARKTAEKESNRSSWGSRGMIKVEKLKCLAVLIWNSQPRLAELTFLHNGFNWRLVFKQTDLISLLCQGLCWLPASWTPANTSIE